METFIKKQRNKYEGLSLTELIFLAKNKAPVNKQLQNKVWEELFFRYFNNGRDFNLYEILENEPLYFSITIGIELQHECINIPVNHVVQFVKNLLDFIKFIDKQLLSKSNIQFDWQLHELNGIKDMLEKVREAKVSNNNLKQEINQFIDKINNARKDALLQIESNKYNNNKSIVITNKQTALMKQELKRLNIPIAKLKKDELISILYNLEMYYPEDQDKILKYGLKRYSYEITSRYPWKSYVLNLESKNTDIKMNFLLGNTVKYFYENNSILHSQECLKNKDYEGFLNLAKEFFMNAKNSSTETCDIFLASLKHELARFELNQELYTQYLLRLLEDNYWLIKKYKNSTLSEILMNKISMPDVDIKEAFRFLDIKYDNNLKQWVLNDSDFFVEVSILEYVTYLMNLFTQHFVGIFEYQGDASNDNNIFLNKGVDSKYYSIIKEYCNFIPSIKIDKFIKDCLNLQHVNRIYRQFNKSDCLRAFFKHKYFQNRFSSEELKLIFCNKDIYKITKSIMDNNSTNGDFSRFVIKYLDKIVDFFDFKLDDDIRKFFKIDFSTKSLINKQDINKAYLLVDKIATEIPHKYHLLEEFFSDIEVEYTEYQMYSTYLNLSSIEKLLLESLGHKIGEEVTKKGYKIDDTIYSSEEVKILFILNYFKNL